MYIIFRCFAVKLSWWSVDPSIFDKSDPCGWLPYCESLVAVYNSRERTGRISQIGDNSTYHNYWREFASIESRKFITMEWLTWTSYVAPKSKTEGMVYENDYNGNLERARPTSLNKIIVLWNMTSVIFRLRPGPRLHQHQQLSIIVQPGIDNFT